VGEGLECLDVGQDARLPVSHDEKISLQRLLRNVTDGVVEVVSEGRWKLLNPA
jgi:hypothetical protein